MTEHPIVTGILLMTVGSFGMAGAITGNLAPMIAAIFDPSDLGPPSSGGSGTSGSNIGSTVQGIALGLAPGL